MSQLFSDCNWQTNPNNFNKRLENKGEKGANSKNENGIYFFKFPSLLAAVKKGTSLFQRCRHCRTAFILHQQLEQGNVYPLDFLSPMQLICTYATSKRPSKWISSCYWQFLNFFLKRRDLIEIYRFLQKWNVISSLLLLLLCINNSFLRDRESINWFECESTRIPFNRLKLTDLKYLKI